MSTPSEAIEVKSATQIIPAEAPTPMSILSLAVQRGADIAQIEKLMDLQERWERREAEKAFVAAMAAFKEENLQIPKNKKVSYDSTKGKVEYKHATLDRETDMVNPLLSKHGLSANWKLKQENGKVRVICVLRHRQGHSEETPLEASPDTSGAKNDIQAIGSTITYMRRYTFECAVGLATRDDADGITFGDVEDAISDMMSAVNLDELQNRFNKHYKRAHASKNQQAMAICIETKNRRKDELTKGIPASQIPPADDEEIEKRILEFHKEADRKGLNSAQKHMLLGRFDGDVTKAMEELKGLQELPANAAAQPEAQPAKRGKGQKGKADSTGTTSKPNAEVTAPSQPKEPDFGF